MKHLVLIFLFALLYQNARAQTWHQVTARSGTQAIGNNTATISTVGTPPSAYGGYAACMNLMFYYSIGLTGGTPSNGYSYNFASPVSWAKIQFFSLDGSVSGSATARFEVNGVVYLLTNNNVSVVPGSSPCTPPYAMNRHPTIVNGRLVATNTPLYDSIVQVDIQVPGGINSLAVIDENSFDGYHFNLFIPDISIYIANPFTDTLFCPLDTFSVAYGKQLPFLTGNSFSAELSDANGSFANPVTIGSVTSTAAGDIACTIPANTPAGTNYRLRLVSSSPARISDTSRAIEIKASPTPISASSNSPLCSGQTLQLSVSTNSTSGISWDWEGPNSFSASSQNTSISSATTAATGDYVVTATLVGTGCLLKDTVSAIVNQVPQTPMATNNGPVCSGNSLQLTAAAAPGSNYNWTGPQSFSSSLPNPIISNTTTAQSGTYTVTVTANGCTSAPATTSVTIKPTPATPVANSNSPVCLGGVLNLSASSSPGSSYNWTGPNGYTSAVQNPNISPAAKADEGIYSVVATLNGCPSAPASTGPVEVNIAATVGAYASPGDTVCAGTNVQFVGFPQGAGTNPAIAWYKNGLLVATNKVYRDNTLVTGDKVWCTVTATGICATPVVVSTDTFRMVVLNIKTHPKVTIQATPEPTGDPDQGIVFLAVATHGGPEPKYQWYINDVPTGGNTLNISMAGVVIGTEIKVEMMSDDPCADQPYAVDSLLVQFPTGIDGQQRKGGLRLYPNPNKGSFTIGGVTANELNVSIVNALGQEVYSARYAGVNGSQAIDASLVPGNYLIKLQTEGGMEVLRFVVD